MNTLNYEQFFTSATGMPDGPYDYQCRLACGERGGRDETAWLESGTPCQSRLIDIPTGLGKTAAVVLAWLWNRAHQQDPNWPRRLVYCLPMRTLVEQTAGNVESWLWNLLKAYPENQDLRWLCGFEKDDQISDQKDPAKDRMRSPIILMGGEDPTKPKREWDIYPEKPAILIGTQDMLLSRALNRGYGMSRYRWPMHFGLLNNDCLWVMDETQLMGVGIETSAQLQALRDKLGALNPSFSWWMSATLNPGQLATVDFAETTAKQLPRHCLSEGELNLASVRERVGASKTIQKAPVAFEGGKAADMKSYPTAVAAFAAKAHKPGTLTLVVVNRVNRAQEVVEALGKQKTEAPMGLIHSRFRPHDRRQQEQLLYTDGDRIVVATQAVEAGIDVSATTLITELAPWPSLTQRFGRCNRYGECDPAGIIHWIDLQPDDEKDARNFPYDYWELQKARKLLAQCSSASPSELRQIDYQAKEEIRPVIRRKDLLQLFDTTSDLSGNDLDISRYVRDSDTAEVQVYWKDFDPARESPSNKWTKPGYEKLVRVPLQSFAAFAKKEHVFRWNSLAEEWESVRPNMIPGAIYLLPVSNGGYRANIGWTGNTKDRLEPEEIIDDGGLEADAHGRDPDSFTGVWVRLSNHLAAAENSVNDIVQSFQLESRFLHALQTAARWHDVGKSHPTFQSLLRKSGEPPDQDQLWAKSEKRGGYPKFWRKGFRHELASALAWIQRGDRKESNWASFDLIAFLIATHHGKIRLSLRAMPNETEPEDSERRFARGIWDGDELPSVELPDGQTVGPLKLDLSVMKLGESQYGPSWLERMVRLCDATDLGPFRLALLETMLRAADARASNPKSGS